ncbi:MAG TPA: hypothetical protein VGM65_01240 [Candidatus Udaeobacter sp.]|jgi:argininosuccinate synthase
MSEDFLCFAQFSYALIFYKGNITVVGHKSPESVYDPKIAAMENDKS